MRDTGQDLTPELVRRDARPANETAGGGPAAALLDAAGGEGARSARAVPYAGAASTMSGRPPTCFQTERIVVSVPVPL